MNVLVLNVHPDYETTVEGELIHQYVKLTIDNSEIRVLLTATGGIHTLGTIDCLKNNYEKRKVRIICTDIIEQPLLRYKADRFYIVPKGNSKNYVKSILKICKKEKINVIIPGNVMRFCLFQRIQNYLIRKKYHLPYQILKL